MYLVVNLSTVFELITSAVAQVLAVKVKQQCAGGGCLSCGVICLSEDVSPGSNFLHLCCVQVGGTEY